MSKKLINIIGKKFGSLLVLERYNKENDKNTYYRCRCDCGKEKLICSQHLRDGKTKQCRECFESKHNLQGKIFGKLIVLKKGNPKKYKNGKIHQTWKCLCSCGNVKEISVHHLIKKQSLSCGCTTKYKDRSEAAFNSLFSNYRISATSRNLEFNITREKFKEITKTNCRYCNQEPQQIIKRGTSSYIYNGIDRKDNSIGYIENNIVSCCKKCNIAKHTTNEKEFLDWICKVFNFNKEK